MHLQTYSNKMSSHICFTVCNFLIMTMLCVMTPFVMRNIYQFHTTDKCQLIIGILSARGNHEQRQAIRDTWLPQRSDGQIYCVHSYFIVGQKSCYIPPEDRLDEYDCKPWEINLNEVGNAKTIHFSSEVVPFTSSYPIAKGLRFQVQHPIVVTKLGVLGSIAQSGKPITAILQSTASQEEVARVTLSPLNVGTSASGYFYRSVEPLILPKGFEGSLFLSEVDDLPYFEEKQNVNYSNGGGLLSFQQTIAWEGIGKAFDDREISVVSLGFTVYDLQALQLHVEQQSTRQTNWDAELYKETMMLRTEMLNHGDILFSEPMDVYRNLPLKLLLFYEWVINTYDFKYLLKTDDDCILNIDNITHFLDSTADANQIWWGRFRYNWMVQRSGKWREVNYIPVVYPPFACGVANVMSSDIVHWAGQNLRKLHCYQGEDVSVGIWLSAIAPKYVQDTMWQCDKGCLKNALSRGQLNPDEIRHSWSMFAQCGQFCSCDIDSK